MSKRPTGRPKTRWEDEGLEDIKSINICNWKNVAQNRDSWKKVVEQTRNLYWSSEVRHPCCVFKLYGEVNSVKNTTINTWVNDGVY